MVAKFVRVKDPDTGHEVSVTDRFAEAYKLTPLNKPAVDANGRPLKAKPHVDLPTAKTTDEVDTDEVDTDEVDTDEVDTDEATTWQSGGTAR